MSTKLAQFFDTISERKFAMGVLALKASLGDISGRGAAQNLNVATQFSTKLAQFFDTILNSKFAMGAGVSWAAPRILQKDEQHKI